MIRVLCDAIHADLLESLAILFEDRFGWELYTPHGLEWYDAGIWRFERETLGDAVARQFLQPHHDDVTIDPAFGWGVARPGTTHPNRIQNRLTLDDARDLRPDIVLSTLAENDLGLHAFAGEVGAHFGVQVGNQGQGSAWGAAEFALISSTTPGFTPWMPHVTYHQEFDTETLFDAETERALPDRVGTWVQCTTTSGGYDRFRELAVRTGLDWRWYGHCGEPDEYHGGNYPTTAAVADRMHEARIAWHWKEWSDGYGHVIHDLFAIGRPVLVTAGYYADKLAGPLMVEGVTSYDIRRYTNDELVKITSRLVSDDDHWRRMCEASARRFREVVDFAGDAERIRAMLDGILSDRLVTA